MRLHKASGLFDANLTKPMKPHQLYEALAEIFERPAAGEELRGRNIERGGKVKPFRILLAEDNVSSRKVGLQMLKRLGYTVDTVANGI